MMKKLRLGRTNLTVNKDALGALPLQRLSVDDAVRLIHACLDFGINFIDSARAYTDSEEKLGIALAGRRDSVILATKSGEKTGERMTAQLETSLSLLKTDYIDIYQLHNPGFIPVPGGEDGLYDALQKARQEGKIRFISITNHKFTLAREAIQSGLYDTIQFPFSYLALEPEISLVNECNQADIGFIAMKGLAGGLITDIGAARAWMNQFNNALPIWGLQRISELEKLKEAVLASDELTPERRAVIEKDRKELAGGFCRGCGYCKPCPAGIEIDVCARMSLWVKRGPASTWMQFKDAMENTAKCLRCGQCAKKCPYGLYAADMLPQNLMDYRQAYAEAEKVS